MLDVNEENLLVNADHLVLLVCGFLKQSSIVRLMYLKRTLIRFLLTTTTTTKMVTPSGEYASKVFTT